MLEVLELRLMLRHEIFRHLVFNCRADMITLSAGQDEEILESRSVRHSRTGCKNQDSNGFFLCSKCQAVTERP